MVSLNSIKLRMKTCEKKELIRISWLSASIFTTKFFSTASMIAFNSSDRMVKMESQHNGVQLTAS